LKDREENFIGSFVLREGESALLSGMERHSIEPFELKAIKAESVDAPLDQSPLRNQRQAIQVTEVLKAILTSLPGFWANEPDGKSIVASN